MNTTPAIDSARAALLATVTRLDVRYTHGSRDSVLDLTWASDAATYMDSAAYDHIADGTRPHDSDRARALTATYLRDAVDTAGTDGFLESRSHDIDDIEDVVDLQFAICSLYAAIAPTCPETE